MKKFAIIGLSLLLTGTLHAQRIIQTQSQKDKLLLSYELPLQQPASDYATVVTPFLCGQNDTLVLEPVVVRGAQNARKLHRDYVLNHK